MLVLTGPVAIALLASFGGPVQDVGHPLVPPICHSLGKLIGRAPVGGSGQRNGSPAHIHEVPSPGSMAPAGFVASESRAAAGVTAHRPVVDLVADLVRLRDVDAMDVF